MAHIFVYAENPSRGAKSLIDVLGATRIRKFDGMDFWDKKQRIQVEPNDVIICWGKPLPQLDGIRTLNSGKPLTRYEQMWNLTNSGIPTIIHATKYQPAFIPRIYNHVNGSDLLEPPGNPDFWVKKENIVNEYRVHSFNDRSIRAGQKKPRTGFRVAETPVGFALGLNAHPWIRTHATGWYVDYDDFQSTRELREFSHKTIRSLHLNFGAVDIGERPDGDKVVLSVDLAPDLGGGILNSYQRAIEKWLEEEHNHSEKEKPKPAATLTPEVPYINPLEQREARYGGPRWNQVQVPPPSAGFSAREVEEAVYRNRFNAARPNLVPISENIPTPARPPRRPIELQGGRSQGRSQRIRLEEPINRSVGAEIQWPVPRPEQLGNVPEQNNDIPARHFDNINQMFYGAQQLIIPEPNPLPPEVGEPIYDPLEFDPDGLEGV